MELMRPLKLGPHQLNHRIVLAPMTRCRAHDMLATPPMQLYYRQRSTAGGLLISEAVCVSPSAHGLVDIPGIYTREQIDFWKPVTEAVREKGAISFLKLWHFGRASHKALQPGQADPVFSTARQLPFPQWKAYLRDESGKKQKHQFSPPRSLVATEIADFVQWFAIGARNAFAAGFDGCEIHGAHGYLIYQFVKDGVNDRTDDYGGSIENQCRLLLEVTQAVAAEIGSQRTGVRISPFTVLYEAVELDPEALLVYLLQELDKLNLAYIHLTEPEFTEIVNGPIKWTPHYLQFTKQRKTPLIVSGGHTRESGNLAISSGYADLVGYGRPFISNPDLVKRFALGAPLNKLHRYSIYDDYQERGYTDYPFLEDIEPERGDGVASARSVSQSRARL